MLVTLKVCISAAVSAAVVSGTAGYYIGSSRDKRKAVKKVVIMTGMDRTQVKKFYETMHSHFSETLSEVIKDFVHHHHSPSSPISPGDESTPVS